MEDIFADDDFVVVQPAAPEDNNPPEDDEPLFVAETDYTQHSEPPTTLRGSDNGQILDEPDFGTVLGNGSGGAQGILDDPVNVNNGEEDDDILGNVNLNGRRKRIVFSEEQLLSNQGLPYLRQNIFKRVRFKSSTRYTKVYKKNNVDYTNKKRVSFTTEYENATKLLQFYQLWAHKVYAKASFSDFVRICYNKKVLQTGRLLHHRQLWIQAEQEKAAVVRSAAEADAENATNGITREKELSQTMNQNASSGNNDNQNNDNNNNNYDNTVLSDDEMNDVRISKSNGLFVGDDDSDNDERSQSINNSTFKDNNSNSTINNNLDDGDRSKGKGNALSFSNDGNDSNSDIYEERSRDTPQPATATLSSNTSVEALDNATSKTNADDTPAEKKTSEKKDQNGDDFDDFDEEDNDEEFWTQLEGNTKLQAQAQSQKGLDNATDIPQFDDMNNDDGEDHEEEMNILREMGL